MVQKYELEVSDKLNRWGYAHHRFKPGLYIIEDAELVAAAKRVIFGVEVRPLTDKQAAEREAAVLYEDSADARGGEGYHCRFKQLAERGVPGFECDMWALGTTDARDAHELRAHGQVFNKDDFPDPIPATHEELGDLVVDNSEEGGTDAEGKDADTEPEAMPEKAQEPDSSTMKSADVASKRTKKRGKRKGKA